MLNKTYEDVTLKSELMEMIITCSPSINNNVQQAAPRGFMGNVILIMKSSSNNTGLYLHCSLIHLR